jgi:Fe-Mn family superoxide dismutase
MLLWDNLVQGKIFLNLRWTWLVEKDGKVSIVKTPNADNPITSGFNPLMVLDVWEHAYYLDY